MADRMTFDHDLTPAGHGGQQGDPIPRVQPPQAAGWCFTDRPTPMLAFIARRLLATIPVLAMVAVFVFLLLRLTPGDPAAVIAGENANAQQIEEIREKLGLSKPLVTQFVIWIGNVLRGDLGVSFFYKKTVAELTAGLEAAERVSRLLGHR